MLYINEGDLSMAGYRPDILRVSQVALHVKNRFTALFWIAKQSCFGCYDFGTC